MRMARPRIDTEEIDGVSLRKVIRPVARNPIARTVGRLPFALEGECDNGWLFHRGRYRCSNPASGAPGPRRVRRFIVINCSAPLQALAAAAVRFNQVGQS